jgi:NAD(P)H-hydrate repair Nnr-like enzyme with NAD(P)H-hydrate epimerase domain
VLALDTPTGVDASSGSVLDPAIRATATMALALQVSAIFSQSEIVRLV